MENEKCIRCRFKNEEGKCDKYNRVRNCRPTTLESCDTPVNIIDANRMCEYGSIFGNSYCYITEKQLEELKNGKVIHHDDGEYGTFIVLRKEDK